MSQEIHVEFQPDGSIWIEAKNFSGADCEAATAFLNEALGEVTAHQRKPEYWQARTQGTIRAQRASHGGAH